MKFGILGGTFDPIHLGHLAIADAARKHLGLDEVYFVPAARTPLKETSNILAVDHRVHMVRLAISDYPYFKLSTVEIDRPGPSYTVDTIADFHRKLGGGNELYFIIGWDSLIQFTKWREPGRIIQMCRLVSVARPGYSLLEKGSIEAAIPGLSQRLVILDEPNIDISATEIRQRVKLGEPIDDLVPEPVAEYIRKEKLYQKG